MVEMITITSHWWSLHCPDMLRSLTRVLVVVVGICLPAAAQWINHRAATTPRTKDGKPNLAAAAPRDSQGRPDLSGIWQRIPPINMPDNTGFDNGLQYYVPDGFQIPFQLWADALYKERFRKFGTGRPSERCLPHGIPDAMLVPAPFKLIQNRGLTLILYEESNHFRQIFTDGRRHPSDMNPAWFGYSLGTWEGETFVVDSVGFNDLTWLDDSGHPHTDALHTIERFRRQDFGHMELEVTIDDSKAYTKRWSAKIPLGLLPDTELIEDICANEKDVVHLQVK